MSKGRLAPLAVTSAAPIKNRYSRGFMVGWLAILIAVAAGFMLMIGPLSHSTADVRLAQIETETINPRS